jgi:hypothetical protein
LVFRPFAGRQERDNNKKSPEPLLSKPMLSSLTGRGENDEADLTRAAQEAENAPKSGMGGKSERTVESEDEEDEEEEAEEDPVITTPSNKPSSSVTSARPPSSSSLPLSSSSTAAPVDLSPTPVKEQSVNSSSTFGARKSAGAQVADVIDRLVAHRKGITPHIVVVAPFRNKRKQQIVQATESDVTNESQASNQQFDLDSAVSAMAHPQELLREKKQKWNEKTEAKSSSMPASSTESTIAYDEEAVTVRSTVRPALDSKDDDIEEDAIDEGDEDDDESVEVTSAEKSVSVGLKSTTQSTVNLNRIKNAVSPLKEDGKKSSIDSKATVGKRKTAIELRAETLNKLRAKLKRPGGTGALFRALNRESSASRLQTSANTINFPSLAKPNVAPLAKSKPEHVELPFQMSIPNAVFLGAKLVKKSSDEEEDALQASASNTPSNPQKLAKAPTMQSFTVREQVYQRPVQQASRPSNPSSGMRNAAQFPSVSSHNDGAMKALPSNQAPTNPMQRSMHFQPAKQYATYGMSPNQRMQHPASFAPSQQLNGNSKPLMMAGSNVRPDLMAPSTGPQITLAQLAQLYPQQYLEFLQQHQPQMSYGPSIAQQNHQQMRNHKKPTEVDPMVAYQQASHQSKFAVHNPNMMMSMSQNNPMRPPSPVQANPTGNKNVAAASAGSNFGENTAESVGHQNHVHSNQLLSGADSGNSAMVNFNVEDGHDKGLSIGLGGGPSSGGAQLITSPMGIFKSLLLPLLPRPRMNLNGKVVFGVVLEKGVGFGKPKKPPVVLHTPHKHGFFG